MTDSKNKQRSLAFSASGEPRFWWHRLLGSDYFQYYRFGGRSGAHQRWGY